ncbi:protein AegA [Treponema primitia ZAS-2]|uniref:HydN n=1 Tax=Treponema primitia (strain ATCC BAA-887 / DSM 12427 / ZAS-2) TaxID=545694 RepID=D8L151_TREPZ|nr:4Fe-4S dicluster domain-containing protein [Treponema primitia]ADJ19595.1 putative Fe-S-cluster-containing hydrogenase component [Treponema primitia ZAS-2]AEF85987.1 protein AegA [Treponema primitia ZAS-2]AEL20844.1 HydN [Treponema primitia ZAS-2]
MNSFIKANPIRCIGCRTCLISCVVAHEGKRIFEIDPDAYNFNPRLFMVKTARVSAPVHCRHCENPACKASCTSGAIYVRDNVVLVDTKKCIGCKNCVIACPFGAVEIVETAEVQHDGSPRKIANKCDLCAGVADSPSCVKVCPTQALALVTEDDLSESVADKRRSAAVAALV